MLKRCQTITSDNWVLPLRFADVLDHHDSDNVDDDHDEQNQKVRVEEANHPYNGGEDEQAGSDAGLGFGVEVLEEGNGIFHGVPFSEGMLANLPFRSSSRNPDICSGMSSELAPGKDMRYSLPNTPVFLFVPPPNVFVGR